MDGGLRRCVARGSALATEGRQGATLAMHSAALHDAAALAAVMPAAMLFIPSVGGVSHNFDEHTHEQDIAEGARAFVAAAAAALLGQCDAGPHDGAGANKSEL